MKTKVKVYSVEDKRAARHTAILRVIVYAVIIAAVILAQLYGSLA